MELSYLMPVLPEEMPPQDGPAMLIAYVEDSGFCVLTAGGQAQPAWRCVINHSPFAAEYGVASYGAPPDQVVPRIVEWARATGLPTPDPARLSAILGEHHTPAENGLIALLEALGIGRPAPARQAKVARAGGAKTVDGLVRQYAATVLAEAGFTQNGRDFLKTNEHGDSVALGFQPRLMRDGISFYLEFGVVPAAYRDWQSLTEIDYASSPLRYRVLAPAEARQPDGDVFPDKWEFTNTALGQGAGTALTRVLIAEAVPFMTSLLQPGALIDVLSNPDEERFTQSTRSPYPLLFPAIDHRPSDTFDEVWERLSGWDYFEDNIRAWATSRAAAPTGRRPSADAVRQQVEPFLAARDYSWTYGAFRKTTASGDMAIIEIAPAHSAPNAFRVDTAIVPRMHWEWLKSSGQVTAAALVPDGWCEKRVAPPGYTPDVLNLKLWHTTDGLTAALDQELSRLDTLLDPNRLLRLITDPTTPYTELRGFGDRARAEILLLLGRVSRAEAQQAIERIEASPFMAAGNEEFLAWAKAH
jgi:hypothetical protein